MFPQSGHKKHINAKQEKNSSGESSMINEGAAEQTDVEQEIDEGLDGGWMVERGIPSGLEITVRVDESGNEGANESGDEEIDPRSQEGEEGA